jgi:hypothetical protein
LWKFLQKRLVARAMILNRSLKEDKLAFPIEIGDITPTSGKEA